MGGNILAVGKEVPAVVVLQPVRQLVNNDAGGRTVGHSGADVYHAYFIRPPRHVEPKGHLYAILVRLPTDFVYPDIVRHQVHRWLYLGLLVAAEHEHLLHVLMDRGLVQECAEVMHRR